MLNNNFCSSPWFHVRISPEGNYRPCRWGDQDAGSTHNISNTTLTEYLQSDLMDSLRTEMLQGHSPKLCENCQYEQTTGKVSGRQRQLLKSAIIETEFDKTFCASPHWKNFEYSYNN